MAGQDHNKWLNSAPGWAQHTLLFPFLSNVFYTGQSMWVITYSFLGPAGHVPWAQLREVVVICHIFIFCFLFYYFSISSKRLYRNNYRLCASFSLMWDNVLPGYTGMFTQMDLEWPRFR